MKAGIYILHSIFIGEKRREKLNNFIFFQILEEKQDVGGKIIFRNISFCKKKINGIFFTNISFTIRKIIGF